MPDLRYERFTGGHYAVFTMDRPDRLNAMNPEMATELREAMAGIETDRRIIAVILLGAQRSFCAGADLGPCGRVDGSVSGSFFHLIDQEDR